MDILAFNDALDLLSNIDAIALAWDGGWPESGAHYRPEENPGMLLVEEAGGQACWRGDALDEVCDFVTVECSDGQKAYAVTFTNSTADEVVTMLGARYRSLHKV